MDTHMSSISNKIKTKIKTPSSTKISQTEPKTSLEQDSAENKVRHIVDSPKNKSNDNNLIPDYNHNYPMAPALSTTLNINFTSYQNNRPPPLTAPPIERYLIK